MRTAVEVTVAARGRDEQRLLAPCGIPTPYQTPVGFSIRGGTFELVGETGTGQMAALIEPDQSGTIVLNYIYAEHGPGYPETLFVHRPNRYTKAADAIVRDAQLITDRVHDGHEAIAAIVNDVAGRFSYGHPEVKYYDGHDEIPWLGCGLTEGSCVDINAYLIASLRTAGFEAGYVGGISFRRKSRGVAMTVIAGW